MWGFFGKEKEENPLVQDLEQALHRDEFEIYLQPQVNVVTCRIEGFEALIRWQHPSLGILRPGEFFMEADELKVKGQLDFLVFDKACAFQYKRLYERKEMFCISCNFSREHFTETDFVEVLEQIRGRYRVPPEYFAIEILEGTAFSREYRIQENVERLRKMGYGVCLDDCGADNSTMADLLLESITEIKIDKKLVDHIEQQNVQILLEGISFIAGKMGYKVVCEGVETKRQYELVMKCGIHVMQGFYFYRPMSTAKAEILYEMMNIKGQVRPVNA